MWEIISDIKNKELCPNLLLSGKNEPRDAY